MLPGRTASSFPSTERGALINVLNRRRQAFSGFLQLFRCASRSKNSKQTTVFRFAKSPCDQSDFRKI
jgi:hypothetical protein